MRLELKRVYRGLTYTIGKLYVDGELFCDTLEDRWRDLRNGEKKVPRETCIPEGTYDITFIYWEKHHGVYPNLRNVPFFDGILIHAGSTDIDTEGCILVGRNTRKGVLTESRDTFKRLMGVITEPRDGKEKITITIC